jgi:hypothetical protein
MLKNFLQYLFIILMIHFIFKKIFMDFFKKTENFENEGDFLEDYKLEQPTIENYETDEESDYDNLRANLNNESSDEEQEEDELEIENQLRKNQSEKKEIVGFNGLDNYREFNFGNDTLNLKDHVKNIEKTDFETTFDLSVPTQEEEGSKYRYKTENIMNGGEFMDNVHGYDNLDGGYAML